MSQHRRGEAGWPRMGYAGLYSAVGARAVLSAGCVSLPGLPVLWYPALPVTSAAEVAGGIAGTHQPLVSATNGSRLSLGVGVEASPALFAPCCRQRCCWSPARSSHSSCMGHAHILRMRLVSPRSRVSLKAALSLLLFLQDPSPTVQRENRGMSHLHLSDAWRAPGAAGEGQSLHLRLCL